MKVHLREMVKMGHDVFESCIVGIFILLLKTFSASLQNLTLERKLTTYNDNIKWLTARIPPAKHLPRAIYCASKRV